jgi:quinol monooxygenase YgiN
MEGDDGAMDEQILTSVSAEVDPSRNGELVDAFSALVAGALPDGLVRTELLRGQDGTWRIQSLWRDRAALMAARESGERPAALVLFERVGAQHAHEVFTVVASTTPETRW